MRRELIKAFGVLKNAAAQANVELKLLDKHPRDRSRRSRRAWLAISSRAHAVSSDGCASRSLGPMKMVSAGLK
jgi:hypothetical protein